MSVDLRPAELAEELRTTVRDVLARYSPWSAVLADQACDTGSALWTRFTDELGLTALAIPERLGGAGAGLRENAVVCAEVGRAVAPVPYLTGAVVATQILIAAGADEWLAQLAEGGRCAVPVVPVDTPPHGIGAPGGDRGVRVEDFRLTGTVRSVADAGHADLLLVPTADELWLVEATAAGVTRTPVTSLDVTRPLTDVGFASAPGFRLAAGAPALRALRWGLTVGAAMLAAEQCGLAGWCLDTTVEYLRTRYQFGRPVGEFQALKHRLADAWVALTQARAVTRYAVAVLAEADPRTGPDTEAQVAAALAQAHCGPVAVRIAEECLQLHGGIGFTWEHPLHLYLKRAKAAAVTFGAADRHRAALAELVGLPPAPRY
jgi:alkylation response protein AidB-like acyl-CoA dehydrogenase